jgi:hypothetical protein
MYVTPTPSSVTMPPLHLAACLPWPRSSGWSDSNRSDVENASVYAVVIAFNCSRDSISHRLVPRRLMLRGVAAAVTGAAVGVGISIGYKVCETYRLHHVTIM